MSPISNLGIHIQRAWLWWIAELGALIPSSLKRLLTPPLNEMIVEILVDGVLITRGRKTESFSISSDAERIAVFRRICSSTGAFTRLIAPKLRLRLSRDKCLVHELRIPSGARSKSAAIADLDLRSAIPFGPEEIYSARTEPIGAADVIVIKSIVIKRRWLDEQLDFLRQAGCEPNSVDAWEVPAERAFPVDFLNGRGDYLTRRLGLSAMALAAAAFVFLIAAAQISWWHHVDALAELDLRIAQSKESAAKIVNEFAAADALAKALTTLRRKKALETSALASWDALSRLMPDSAWLSQLRRDGEKITITGAAAEAAPLIGLIDRDPLFTGVSFASPVNFDSNLGAERFVITMAVEKIDVPNPAKR